MKLLSLVCGLAAVACFVFAAWKLPFLLRNPTFDPSLASAGSEVRQITDVSLLQISAQSYAEVAARYATMAHKYMLRLYVTLALLGLVLAGTAFLAWRASNKRFQPTGLASGSAGG